MATKISKVNAERLKKLGISAKTEEEAKKILLDRLEKAGIPGMDEETIDNLIDIVGSFAELEGDAEEEAAPADPTPAEAQADELAEEAAEEEAEAAAEEDPEPEAEPEEESETEEAPAPKPKKTAAAPKKKTAPAKKESEAAEKPAKKAEKAEKKPSKRNDKGIRLKPQTNPEHLDLLRKELSKFFPEKEFQYVAVSQGISIKFGGANSHPVAIMFENVYSKDGDFATTNVVLNTFRSQASQDKLADDGVDFVPTWNNLPWLKGIAWSEAMEIVKTYLPDIKSAVSTADNRLGKNREKMEADLKATGKKAAPAPKKAPAKAEPADDPKAKARAALAKAAAAKKAKAAKK